LGLSKLALFIPEVAKNSEVFFRHPFIIFFVIPSLIRAIAILAKSAAVIGQKCKIRVPILALDTVRNCLAL